jgi:hypothetical protein
MRLSSVKRSKGWLLVPALAALGLAFCLALPAAAESGPGKGKANSFHVTVLVVSPQAGEIDARARRFDRILRKRIRYESLRFVREESSTVRPGGIGSVSVPGSRAFRFRPIDAGGQGALVAVEWGATRGDFRIHKGKPLILGGPATAGGELVVVLESR